MSANFQQVKRDILKDMKAIACHTPESWADIMIQNTQHLTTKADQESFWNWIMNPSESRDYKAPTFSEYDTNNVEVPEFQTMKVVDEEDEKSQECEIVLQNKTTRNGMTMFVETVQTKC